MIKFLVSWFLLFSVGALAAYQSVPHVQGNRLISENGANLILRGTNIEFLNVHPSIVAENSEQQKLQKNVGPKMFKAIHEDWKMNVIRLPLSCWLWKENPKAYLRKIKEVVQDVQSNGLYVVLALHTQGKWNGSPNDLKLPPKEAGEFWRDIASAFKENPKVIFDVFNEPIIRLEENPSAQDWELWRNGGVFQGQRVLGMETLSQIIRSTGAAQPLVVQGLVKGSTFANVGRLLLSDKNIVYSIHPYFSRNLESNDWEKNFGFLSEKVPLFAGEFGLMPSSVHKLIYNRVPQKSALEKAQSIIEYFEAHHISWAAYSFAVSSEGYLIQDYMDYKPTSFIGKWSYGDENPKVGMGEVIKASLEKFSKEL